MLIPCRPSSSQLGSHAHPVQAQLMPPHHTHSTQPPPNSTHPPPHPHPTSSPYPTPPRPTPLPPTSTPPSSPPPSPPITIHPYRPHLSPPHPVLCPTSPCIPVPGNPAQAIRHPPTLPAECEWRATIHLACASLRRPRAASRLGRCGYCDSLHAPRAASRLGRCGYCDSLHAPRAASHSQRHAPSSEHFPSHFPTLMLPGCTVRAQSRLL